MSDPTRSTATTSTSSSSGKTPFSTCGPSTLRCTTISSMSVSFLVRSNFSMFRRIGRLPTSSPSPLVWTSCGNSRVLGLRQLDVPNLRGRRVSRDRAREQERSGKDRDTESDAEFDFRFAEEAEGGFAEKSRTDRRGATEGESRSQPSMGEMRPSRARNLKTNWRQPTRTRAKTDRK